MEGYRFVALTLLNTMVVLVLLNTMLYLYFSNKDDKTVNPISSKYGDVDLNLVYPDMDQPQIEQLLDETWSRPYIYKPFTQFGERAVTGRYVNVDANGFRIGPDQGAWPPRPEFFNLFIFGGSTSFGYGVSDEQTIAAHLQELLSHEFDRPVRVYNFGQGHYYSTQERVQFIELLASGYVPDMALFIDGLNDFYFHSNEPLYTERFRKFVSGRTANKADLPFISETSVGRAVAALNSRLRSRFLAEAQPRPTAGGKNGDAGKNKYNDPEVINSVIDRYLNNKKIIEAVAAHYGTIPVFVWQPVPNYRYDQEQHLFAAGGYGRIGYSRFGYRSMSRNFEPNQQDNNFLWCADLQVGEERPLYVDKVHYSAYFSRKFAHEIARLMIDRSLIPGPDS